MTSQYGILVLILVVYVFVFKVLVSFSSVPFELLL